MNLPCLALPRTAIGVGPGFVQAGEGLLPMAPPGASVRRGRER